MDKRLIYISISIALLLILISCASAASMTAFDGKHITIYDSKCKVASVLTFSGVNDITTEGGYLYIAKDNLVKIYNIKVPAHPMGVNNFKPGGDHIIAQKNMLYVSDDKTFYVYDISSPTKPKQIYKSICVAKITSIQPRGKLVIIRMQGGFIDTIRIG